MDEEVPMERVFAWLEKRPTFRSFWWLLGLIIFIQVAWTLAVVVGLDAFDLVPKLSQHTAGSFDRVDHQTFLVRSITYFVVAGFEELCKTPVILSCLVVYQYYRSMGRYVVIVGAVLSAVVFGLLHMANFDTSSGVIHVAMYVLLIQGVGALFSDALFLKCSGLRLANAPSAFAAVVLMHWMWDMIT